MDTLTTIKTRRAVREWESKDVPQEVLHQVLDAGRFSPSPLNSQPWHFIILKNKATISTLMQSAQHGEFATEAPVVVVVTVDTGAKVDKWLFEHEQHIYSGVCAIMNMWLATWSLGLGGCWVTIDKDTARKMLNIPDTHLILGSLALGYAKELPKEHKLDDRKPLEEMVSYETF